MDNSLESMLKQGLPEDWLLDEVYEIEDVLQYIGDLKNDIDYWKGLKRHRNEIVDKKIEKLNEDVERMRKLILNSMIKLCPDKKTIDFAPLGKVTRRKASKTWEIQDEEMLLQFLEDNGLKEEVIETKEMLKKVSLKSVLNRLVKTNSRIPGAILNPGEESITIQFETSENLQKSEVIKNDSEQFDQVEELEQLEI